MNSQDAHTLAAMLVDGYKGHDAAALRAALGWSEERFLVAKADAVGRGLIYSEWGCWYAEEGRS